MNVLLGLVAIVMGIVMLAFPNVTRSLDRFSNEMKGVETKQGGLYEVNRMVGGGVLVVMGLILLFVQF